MHIVWAIMILAFFFTTYFVYDIHNSNNNNNCSGLLFGPPFIIRTEISTQYLNACSAAYCILETLKTTNYRAVYGYSL